MTETAEHHNPDDCRVGDPPATTPTAKFLEKIKDHCFDPAHDYFGRTHTMVSQLQPPDENRPAAPSRARTAVENLLPAGIVRRGRSRPPPSTPHLERSISSMADSFVDYWGVCSRNPDLEGSTTPVIQEDGLTPISNWAHLNYMKSQRNALRTELKTHQIAGAEAKRSVASLRRLAFRMAVNISVKERQIATSARNLAKSRNSNYLEGRDAEKRVEALKRALRVEEGRNKEILEALERASMLTLQYVDPTEAQHRRPRNPLSPPPSPPTRLSNLSMTTLSDPRTPPRSTSSSWHDADWELTPGIESPTEVRTSDSRLIRAKRESDQALSACRRRINELQAECTKSKEDGETLEASKSSLEKEIEEQQARMAILEQARVAVEETLESTRLQLEVSTGLEEGLKQKLRMKNKELASWEQSNESRQSDFSALEKERSSLLKQLEERNTQLEKLEMHTTALQESLRTLEDKLHAAQRDESSLRDQLTEKESANVELKKRIDRGSKYEQILQKKIAEHEQEILANVKKINIDRGLVSSLREHVKQSENSKKNTEDALATLRAEMTNLEVNRAMDVEERDRLTLELSSVQTTKKEMEEELHTAKTALAQESAEKADLQSDLQALRSSHDVLNASLQAAKSQIRSLERTDADTQVDFEILQDEKAAIEADLRDARQTLFTLREAERMSSAELSDLKSSVKDLQHGLQMSKEQGSALESDLAQARAALVAADQIREEESRRHTEQRRELHLSVTSLHASLEASEKLKTSLQKELQLFKSFNSDLDNRLNDSLRLKTELQTELNVVRSHLEHTTNQSGDLTAKVAELEANLSASHQSKEDVEVRLGTMDTERQMLTTLVSELELALQESRDTKNKLETTLHTHQMEGKTSIAQIAEMQVRLNEFQEYKEETGNKLSDALTMKLDLQNQLQIARSKLAKLELEAGQVQSELSTLHEDIERSHRSKMELEERLKGSENARDELKNQLRLTHLRLEDVEMEVTASRSEIAAGEDELEKTRQAKVEIEKKLEEALESHAQIEKELNTARQNKVEAEALEVDLLSARSRLTELQTSHSRISTKLQGADGELSTLRQSKTSLEGRLTEALMLTTKLEQDLESTRMQLRDSELRHATLTSRVSATDQELAIVRNQHAEAIQLSESISTDLSFALSRLDSLESEKANMVNEAIKAKQEVSDLRDINAKLEKQINDAARCSTKFEIDLEVIRKRLEVAESEGVTMKSRIVESDKELDTLRVTNSKLAESEKDLQDRLKSAEDDLQKVQDTNKRLEAFLERVEEDMAHAETAFEESEKRLEEFVDESQAKLDAARNAKLKYKRRLSEKNMEIEILINKNSELHHQIGEKAQELSVATKGKEAVAEQLSEKERFVDELRSSSDKRMRSMNLAYNELRSKYEGQLREQHDAGVNRFQAGSQTNTGTTNHLPHNNDDPTLAFVALEQEAQALREDKKAFEHLVATLQEKIRHLQTLEEWQEQSKIPSNAGPSRVGLDSVPSSPTTQHSRSSRPGSVLSRPTSISHPSALNDRPTTRASTASKQEDLNAWANEVERIRMLRNEQAIQLRNNKKARSDLRKSLKESKTQLHQLERQGKPNRHRTLLKKNRPSTDLLTSAAEPDQAISMPTTPSRPTTSYAPFTPEAGTARSRHTIHFSPSTFDSGDRPSTSTPLSMPSRWSTLHRPKSSHRPATSGGLGEGRPTTSAGTEGNHEAKEKRRWSTSLKKLFK